jgi:hypothetical protein
MTEEKVKRPRGNPNWKKKIDDKVTDQVTNIETGQVYQYRYVDSESDVWLKLYCSIIGTYQTAGPAIAKAAALNADEALKEYNKRYNR